MNPLRYVKLLALGTLIGAIILHDVGLLVIGFSAILWAEIRELRDLE